jgi:rhamnose utilization protein RhaD (predicted bifunctional aldolase and dehydrogenase)
MSSVAAAETPFQNGPPELESLRELSARLGRDPLLVQASTGNTSIKLDGTLWIKASGTWLADAQNDQIFVPLDLTKVTRCLEQNADAPETAAIPSTGPMRASIETFMHAVLRHRVVIHVHSVNTIAWAVRQDAEAQLTERLMGLPWRWVPYVVSGLPLALEIDKHARDYPDTNIFVLGNHGLVVCGPDCSTAENLLWEVERRLTIAPRGTPQPRCGLLTQLTRISPWRIPHSPALHALGTDAVSRRILKAGVLYPCQAIFLGQNTPMVPCSVPFSEVTANIQNDLGLPFLVLEGCGVLVRDTITRSELATLTGLVQIMLRMEASAPVRYLGQAELMGLLTEVSHQYRQSAEANHRSSELAIQN